jgi:alanine dehydrogenase
MTATAHKRFSIGLPACSSPSERRFPLTPEGVKQLVDKGYSVMIEPEAAATIHYCDNAYSRYGARIADRATCLGADIVIHLAPLSWTDVAKMRRGAMLLTLLHLDKLSAETIDAMRLRGIVGVAVDLIRDDRGQLPFADILAEIDGRASIALASSMLADANQGKGILLGGVAGVVPCEVTIIGSNIAAIAAARSASGLGAIVRIFDNDAYSLRAAARDLGPQIIGSALHEKVLQSALRSADIIVATTTPTELSFGADVASTLKKGVVVFDLSQAPGRLFPSLQTVDLASAESVGAATEQSRRCYINAGSAVPRTAAMALSNTFNTMLDNIVVCEGLTNALKLTDGLRYAVFTFLGKITNSEVARIAGCRPTDINLFLQLS